MTVYKYSHSVDAAELKKWGVFTTMEVRKHNQEELAFQGSREFLEDVERSWDCEISWKNCAQKNGHVIALCVPECLPEKLALLSAICDLAVLQDDIFENTTDAQRENTAQVEVGVFGSVLQGKGLPPDSLARSPKLKKDVMKKVLAKDPSLTSLVSQEVDRVATALPRDRMTYDTLDTYMDERLRDASMSWFYELCAYGMDLKLNEREQEQSRRPTLEMQKAIIYTNDLFSWAKEKAEQQILAADKDIFNAVAVLMKEQRISETAALDLLREKTIKCEMDHFAAVSDLECAGPISENLYRYLDMTRFCHSGIMFWSAMSDRYNRTGVAQAKGEVVKRDHPLSASVAVEDSTRLAIPISISNGMLSSNGHAATDSALLVENQAISAKGSAINGDTINQLDGTRKPEEVNGSHMTFVEDAKDIALAPYKYVKALPSKGIRELLIDGLNLWLRVPEQSLKTIRDIVVMLHTSALMLDDIEDGSKLRRGMPSAHTVYGESQTINSASYVQTRAFAEAAKLSNPASVSIFCDEIENLYIGQSLDLHWKFHVDCPSEKDYFEMVDGKTGSLFRLILGLMQAESPHLNKYGSELTGFIETFGRYFQIRDDYQNLASSDYTRQKGFCEDLDEGKISLPIIHCMRHSSAVERAQIKGIFIRARNAGGGGLSPELKTFVLRHLDERTGSLAYVRGVLKDLERDLKEGLAAVENVEGVENAVLRSLLGGLEI